MSNTVEVKIPAGRAGQRVEIRTTVSAKWIQKVIIKPDGMLPYLYEWKGQGQGGTVIGKTDEDISRDRVFTITAEHSEDGGNTWKPNSRKIRVATIQTNSFPPISITTVRTEDGGDKDFDDSVTHFIW